MCHNGRTHTEHDELVERGVLGRLPRLAPHLIPARQHARMAVPALAVLDRQSPRHARAALLEELARLAQGVRVEPELRLEILDRAGTRGREMADELRAVVVARLSLLERGAAQGVRGAGALGREEQRLSAVQLRLEDVLML